MHEAFDTRLDLDERAVIGDRDHLAFDARAYREALDRRRPRVGDQLLVAQADALFVAVELEHFDLNVLADLEEFVRVLDAAPGHVGYVEQAVQTAEVDERAVFGDVLDLALDDDALFEVLERLALLAVDHLFEDDLARENDVAAFLVNLQDPDFDLLVPEAVEVADRANVDLAAGQERLNAPDVDAEAAFYPIRHARDDVRALLVRLLDLLPRLHSHGVGARKLHIAFGVFELFDVDVDFIARVDRNLLAVLDLADLAAVRLFVLGENLSEILHAELAVGVGRVGGRLD